MTIQNNTTTSISNQVKIKSATIGDESVNSVDARELHLFLGSGQKFADWVKIKVVENPFFEENQDYILLHRTAKQIGRGGHNRKDYALTQDTAKKVSMAEQTVRGNEARDYFLLMEKQAKSLPVPSDKKEQLDIGYVALGHLKNHLKMSDVSYLGCAQKLHNELGVSTAILPNYVENVRATFSATDLLKKNDCGISARVFNVLLIDHGILKVKTRTGAKGKIKKYNSITGYGLTYGQNDASPSNPRETQPHWYEDTFMDLFYMVAVVG